MTLKLILQNTMKIILGIVLFIAIPQFAIANDFVYNRFQYGIFGNYIQLNTKSDFRNLPGYPTCSPGFKDGKGTGYEFGILAEYPIFKMLFAGTRIGFEKYNTELSANQNFLFQNGNTVSTGMIQHHLETVFSNVFGEIYLGFRPVAGLILSSGIKISLPFSPLFSQKESLEYPSDYGVFENGKRERNVVTNQDLPDVIKPIAIAKFGISYEFPLNSTGTVRFAPEISYNYPLTSVIDSYNWYNHSVRIGAALKFSRDEIKPLEIDISSESLVEIRKFKSCDSSYTQVIPDALTFIPTIYAPAGIDNWEFKLFRGNQVLTDYRSKDTVPEKMVLPIANDTNFIKNLDGEYSYKLKVVDKQGNLRESEKKLKVIDKYFSLSTGISGYGIDIENGQRYTKKTIQLLRKISTNVRPLLNYVFFDTKSEMIPVRYNRINNNDTYTFDETKMYNSDAIQVYHHLLNILGKRMREFPDAEITLCGSVSSLSEELSNIQLARERALSVRNYLTNIWDIDTTRINITVSPRPSGLPQIASTPGYDNHFQESAEENQRVEIIPNPEYSFLLDPVITTDTTNQVFPLQFVFHPEIKASGQKYNWQLNIAQNEKLFAKYQGDKNLPDSIVLNLKNREAEMIDKGGNLFYEFFVQDEFGQKCKNSGEIKVEMIKLDSSFYKYSLILFEYESFNIEQKNKQIIELVKQALVTGSSVSITGFTDGLGDSTSNRILSKNRALFTAKNIFEDQELKADDKYPINNYETTLLVDRKFYQQLPTNKDITSIKVSVFGNGEDLPMLYDNTTPEGRFYCRTVTVTLVNELHNGDK